MPCGWAICCYLLWRCQPRAGRLEPELGPCPTASLMLVPFSSQPRQGVKGAASSPGLRPGREGAAGYGPPGLYPKYLWRTCSVPGSASKMGWGARRTWAGGWPSRCERCDLGPLPGCTALCALEAQAPQGMAGVCEGPGCSRRSGWPFTATPWSDPRGPEGLTPWDGGSSSHETLLQPDTVHHRLPCPPPGKGLKGGAKAGGEGRERAVHSCRRVLSAPDPSAPPLGLCKQPMICEILSLPSPERGPPVLSVGVRGRGHL